MTKGPAPTKRPLEGAEYKAAVKHRKLSPMVASSVLNIHTNSALPTVPSVHPTFSASEGRKPNQGLFVPSFEVMYKTDPYKSSKTIVSHKVSSPVPAVKNLEETNSKVGRVLEQRRSSRIQRSKRSPSVVSPDMSKKYIRSPASKQVTKKKVHLEDGRKACPECNIITKNMIEMLIHLKKKHKTSERPYPCPRRSCQRFFIEKQDAERHL